MRTPTHSYVGFYKRIEYISEIIRVVSSKSNTRADVVARQIWEEYGGPHVFEHVGDGLVLEEVQPILVDEAFGL